MTKTTDYVGNKVYENGTLKRILVDGGYIESGTYYFYQTDHLGNNRIVANQGGTAIQKNHYYPFGTAFADKYDDGKNQPYKYNGKELDQMHGLNLYDYSARYYESAIGRFTTVDPHAENYYSWSPYSYVGNNPVRITDPTGMDWYQYKNEEGKIATIWQEGKAETITVNEQSYSNIGETYSQTTGNVTYNYNQNDLQTIDYTAGARFQAQTSGTGCKIASDNMTRSSGANPSSGRSGEILMAKHNTNGQATTPTASANAGINRIESEVASGSAITIGVDYKAQQKHNLAPNGDGMTDHFVTVVGMTVNVETGTTTYRFYDPGSRVNGNSPTNTMSLRGGFLQGTVAFPAQNRDFKVTTVRKNR